MSRDDKIAKYWGDITNWCTLVSHPVKNALDKIFMKYLIKTEADGNYVKTMVEAADITDPFSYVVSIENEDDIEIGFTVYVNGIHNRNILDLKDSEIPKFDEKKANKWKASDDEFDIYLHDTDNMIYSLNEDDLKVLSAKLLSGELDNEDIIDEMEKFIELDDDKRNEELFSITNDEKYLSNEAKDIFIF